MESIGKLTIILISSVFGSFGIQFILSNIDGRYKNVKRYSKELVSENGSKKEIKPHY